jgi:hypothetical protein
MADEPARNCKDGHCHDYNAATAALTTPAVHCRRRCGGYAGPRAQTGQSADEAAPADLSAERYGGNDGPWEHGFALCRSPLFRGAVGFDYQTLIAGVQEMRLDDVAGGQTNQRLPVVQLAFRYLPLKTVPIHVQNRGFGCRNGFDRQQNR